VVFALRAFKDDLAAVIVHSWPEVVFVEVKFERVEGFEVTDSAVGFQG
jgi:hypothetical protein